jgi:hypothetical protein
MGRTESEEFLDQVLEEDVDENEEEENFSMQRVREIDDSLAWGFSGWFATRNRNQPPRLAGGQAGRMVGRSSGTFNRRAVVQCESDNKFWGIR